MLLSTSALLLSLCTNAQSQFDLPVPLVGRTGVTGSGVVIDVDGDGILDVLKNTTSTDDLFLYRGLGGGEFLLLGDVLPPYDSAGATQDGVGDLDGDGDIDLLVSGDYKRKMVNDGAGRFSISDLSVGGGSWRTAKFADINGDGVRDLVLARSVFVVSPTLEVFWIDGQGGDFSVPPVFLLVLNGNPTFDILDIDGDGIPDVYMKAPNSGLRVAYGLGGTAFAPFAPLSGPASTAVFPLTIRDVTGDGVAEIFAARASGLKYFRATGPRTYAQPTVLAPSLLQVNSSELLDLDSDGDLDLFHITSDVFGPNPGVSTTALVYLQSAPGVFSPGPPTSAQIPHFANVKDLDGDGRGDLLLSGGEGLEWQLGGTGIGTDYFGPVETTNSALPQISAHDLADLDQDGDADVVLVSSEFQTVGWIENLGDGELAAPTVLAETLTNPTDFRAVDSDSDGDVDLVVLGREGTTAAWNLTLLQNSGSGALAPVGTPLPFFANSVIRFDVMDFDADGNADVLLHRDEGMASRPLELFLGDGAGGFNRAADPLPPAQPYLDVRPGDVNGDGLLDLVVLTPHSGMGQSLFVAINQGSGTFSLTSSQPILGQASWVNAIDLDQDGHLDAVSSDVGGVTLFQGDGTGSLQAGTFLGGSILIQPEFADLDSDGDLDAYSTTQSFGRRAQWSEQLPGRFFANDRDIFDVGSMPREIPKFADLDGDGDLDAIVGHPAKATGAQLQFNDNLTLSDIGMSFCDPQTANSSGDQGLLAAYGSEVIDRNAVELRASSLPVHQFGLFVGSRTVGAPTGIPGSMGALCLTNAIGRYQGPGQIQSSGVDGRITLSVDLQQLQDPNGVVVGMAGQSWSFQVWHRDIVAGAATSNLTTGVTISLR